MADPKNKAVNGGNGIEKAIADTKVKTNGNSNTDKTPKQSKLWQMVALAKEVAKDAEGISDFEKSIEGRRALENDLELKKGEVQKLRDFNDKLIREFAEYKSQSSARSDSILTEFEQRYKVYDSNKTQVETMQAEVTEAKVKLEAARVDGKNKQAEAEKLTLQLKSAGETAKGHEAEMKDLNAECELQRSRIDAGATELAECKTKLAAARTDLGDDILVDYDSAGLRKLGLELQALSKKCHTLTLEYFNDPEGAKDSGSEIQELKDRFPKIPLSIASTKAAGQLRCAAAEAVIANILTTQIFVPFYLAPDAKAAASTLLDVFGDDERRRAVYRCQVLLSLKSRGEEAARIEEDIVRKASNEVRTTLHPLVSAEKQAGFYNAVPGLFRDALKVWAEVQRARELITAERPDLNEVQPPGKYDEYDQPTAMSPRSPRGSPAVPHGVARPKGSGIAAVLFPQVATREDLIFNGMALWTHQTETPPAAPAVIKSTPPVVANGNSDGRRHQRRRSVVADETPFKAKQNTNGPVAAGNTNGGASVVANRL